MKQKALVISLGVMVFPGCCQNESSLQTSGLNLLTNGSNKSWKVVSETPEDDDPNCRSNTDRVADNSLIFSSDGIFTFDHGTITDAPTCADVINVTGHWTFTNHNEKLLVTLTGATDQPELTFNNDTLIFATIKSLTQTPLIITQDSVELVLTPR